MPFVLWKVINTNNLTSGQMEDVLNKYTEKGYEFVAMQERFLFLRYDAEKQPKKKS